eukprot:6292053-Amphidinium_carterae.1
MGKVSFTIPTAAIVARRIRNSDFPICRCTEYRGKPLASTSCRNQHEKQCAMRTRMKSEESLMGQTVIVAGALSVAAYGALKLKADQMRSEPRHAPGAHAVVITC